MHPFAQPQIRSSALDYREVVAELSQFGVIEQVWLSRGFEWMSGDIIQWLYLFAQSQVTVWRLSNTIKHYQTLFWQLRITLFFISNTIKHLSNTYLNSWLEYFLTKRCLIFRKNPTLLKKKKNFSNKQNKKKIILKFFQLFITYQTLLRKKV